MVHQIVIYSNYYRIYYFFAFIFVISFDLLLVITTNLNLYFHSKSYYHNYTKATINHMEKLNYFISKKINPYYQGIYFY